VLDLAGNVWEWTRSLWGVDTAGPDYRYPYMVTDGRDNIAAGREVRRVQRGGAFDNDHGVVRCAYRYEDGPGNSNGFIGFRVVVLLTP
jgi:formylglycine-generating enzyme required for sulfatase activity